MLLLKRNCIVVFEAAINFEMAWVSGMKVIPSTNISELIVSNIWFYKFSSASGGYVFDMSFPLQRAFLWNRPRIKTNITQNTASKVSYPKIFWSAFSHIWIKYRDLQSKFLYSVQIREIRTWKTQNTNTFHSVKPLKSCCRPFCSVKSWCLWHVIGSATIRFDCSTRKQFIRTEIYSKVSRVIAIF